jgi:phenylpropionate dioxygenase-like ring-hydroxylating dioxygenase large terminal subunit
MPTGTKPGIPIARATTIPSSWYFDVNHHAREVERVFKRTWQQVALASDLHRPGDYVTVDLAGEPLVLVRGRDDVLRAFYNVCRHRAGVVAEGAGCAKAFSCAYHGWSYGLDGGLLAAPEMDGVEGFAVRDVGLMEVPCAAWGPLVFVNLDPEATPLLEALGPLPEKAGTTAFSRMEFGGRVPYTIACNWKAYVDNYLEGYHIPKAHPGLNKVLDYKRYVVRAEGSTVTQGGPGRGASGPPENYLYLWLFPNFMINVSPDYAQTNLILPAGPESTLCLFDYFFLPGSSAAKSVRKKRSMAWADAIQQEDIGLCEGVQKNLHSASYATGRYSAKRENGVYHFHELLRRVME